MSDEPKKGEQIGSICGYCGTHTMERDKDKKVGCDARKKWVHYEKVDGIAQNVPLNPITEQAEKKVTKWKEEGKWYWMSVCPACGTIIDVIERPGRR